MESVIDKGQFFEDLKDCEDKLNEDGSDLDVQLIVQDLGDEFDEIKMSGRLEVEELISTERRLTNLKEIINKNKVAKAETQLQQSEVSLTSHFLQPAKSKLSGFFSAITGQASVSQPKQLTQAKNVAEMKRELLFTSQSKSNQDENSTLRQRNVGDAGEDELKQHQDVHEQIAGEMIALTKTLKHNITVAGKIVRDDIQVLQKTSERTDSNLRQLKHEASRLDSHLQKGTSWWLWISLAVVVATFLSMIFFIRFFPKPR